MTEYSDTTCQNQLPTTKSYVNGQYIKNANGECTAQIKCTADNYDSDSVPANIEYGALRYYSDECLTETYFQAMITSVCVPFPPSDSSPYLSMNLSYPFIHLYTSNDDCTGAYVVSSYFDLYFSCQPVTSYSLEATQQMSPHPRMQTTLSDPLGSFVTMIKKHDQLKSESKHTGLRHQVSSGVTGREATGKVDEESVNNEAYYFDFDDDYFGTDDYYATYTHVSSTLFNVPYVPFDWDDDWTLLTKGAIAGIVIGSICCCGIISVIIYFLIQLVFGVGKAVNNSRAPVEASVANDYDSPPIVTVVGSDRKNGNGLEMHGTSNPILR